VILDIMKLIQVDNGRIFALHLRAGHKWSDGTRFTTEDFRYYWQDVATNSLLSPVVPPNIFRVDGELPKFRIADAQMVEFSWSKANPYFLGSLARSRPIFIYRPAHYLKQFYPRYQNRNALDAKAQAGGMRN
jgi:peptide/nickel transport system substrate-binding protein